MAIIGTIQEQGFVTQNSNLGFRPLTESEKKQLEKNLDKEIQITSISTRDYMSLVFI